MHTFVLSVDFQNMGNLNFTFLVEADFAGSDLERALFKGCDLEKANFIGAKNYSIDVTANTIKGARFSLPEAISLFAALGIELV